MRWQEIKDNPQARQRLEKRAQILKLIRQFFWQEEFIELDTPLLTRHPALEVHLSHLETEIIDERGQKFPAFLITSPEYSLKKMLAAGLTKIFQLGKVFRNNEPWNSLHNPEFTMLEWYRAGADYHGIMEDTERLICFLANELKYQGPVDLSTPWPRLSMRQAWQKYADVDLNNFLARKTIARLASGKKYPVSERDTFDDLFFKIFLSEIEPKIAVSAQPIFLCDYPASMAALSCCKKDDPRYAERFELYIDGFELANAYSELTDATEQETRFKQDQEKRRQINKTAYNIDTDFLAALRSGLPDCGGIALGIDRLIMLLTDAKNISQVLPLTIAEQFND